MTGYSVSIKESSKELSAKERIALKDTTNAIKLDVACDGEGVVITPVAYAILSVHNDKADGDKDYEQYIIEDKDGDKFVTGSQSFFNSFKAIADEMDGEDEEWSIKAYKMPSKNYSNKFFLTCSII